VTDTVLAGLIAGYGVAIPVGAIGALLVSLTARTSMRIGAAAALGVATADLLYAVAAVLGGAALARVIAPFTGTLRWIAAVVLVALAARTAWTAWRTHCAGTAGQRDVGGLTDPLRAFLALLGLTLLNPATIIYFAALVLGRQAKESGTADAMVFVTAAFVASASWQLLLAGSGAVLGRALTGPRARLATAFVAAAVIAALAVTLVA
jgi:arginine exporter protein ArgO